MLDAVEALAMDALLFQCSDHTLDHAILLRVEPAKAPPVRARWRGGRDELLLQPIAAYQCREPVTGKNEPVLRPRQELLRDPAQGAKPGDQGMLQRAGCGRGLAGSRQMPAQQLAGMEVDDQGQPGPAISPRPDPDMSVDQRSFGAWATDGTASMRGRMPISRLRTCQPLS